MQLNTLSFLTSTILNWQPLLERDGMKKIITDSLALLSLRNKLAVYGFVIMPNHMHLLLKTLEMNGKEYPEDSLLKFTAHSFKKHLGDEPHFLSQFRVNDADRQYQFWRKNSLVKNITGLSMMKSIMGYIHHNPLQPHWRLAKHPNAYYYSSAAFYNNCDRSFPWLVDYRTLQF